MADPALTYPEAIVIGLLFLILSRSVATIGTGLRGLSHEDAARFAFLLATP